MPLNKETKRNQIYQLPLLKREPKHVVWLQKLCPTTYFAEPNPCDTNSITQPTGTATSNTTND